MALRIGLLAASRIAEWAVVEPARRVAGVEVTAVAARDLTRARDAADRWGVLHAFGSYPELLAAGLVDAVYVATPASLHRPWVLASLDAGLHVLCEKPVAANADDANTIRLAATATDRVVMEAFHWRYHPLVGQMRAALDRIGPIRRVDAWFVVEEGRIGPGDIRWDIELGGGATMDLGCYAIAWVRWAVGAEPVVVSAQSEANADGVDAWLAADLSWGDGITGSVFSSMVGSDRYRGAGLVVEADHGTMRVDNPLAPQNGSTLTIETTDVLDVLPIEASSTYFHQLSAFRDAVVDGTPIPTGPDEAVANMEVIDSCYRAAGLAPRPTHVED
ncbi:MAG: Gfo/Idh/MocA family oxidoreductase [Acidimicrobiia bacterium]